MELARLAVDFELTAHARKATIEAIADTITAAAATERSAFIKPLRDIYGPGHSAIWFTGETASVSGAAFANALSAAARDLDDGHRKARGHPGAAVVPSVFAELDQRSFEQRPMDVVLRAQNENRLRAQTQNEAVFKAIAVGYEIGLRVASAKRFYARTGFWAGLAVAAALGNLRGLSLEKLAHALAISAETGPHMATTTAPPAWPQPKGTDVKEGIPWGVTAGLAAVSLAQAGMRGALDLVDHSAFFDTEDICAPRAQAMICETYTKFHAACRHVHAPVEAVAALIEKHSLDWQDLRDILVEAYSGALRIPNTPTPRTVVDAQYSIPYCIGLVAVNGLDALASMGPGDLGNKHAEAIAQRVRVTKSTTFEKSFPAKTLVRVTLKTKNSCHVSPVTAPSGESDHRPNWALRRKKLVSVTAPCLSDRSRERLLRAIDQLKSGELSLLCAELFTHHAPPQEP